MSIDVDVRQSKFYTEVWDPVVEPVDRLIRFRVTDDHYLFYMASRRNEYNRLCEWEMRHKIAINQPPAVNYVEELDYEVIVCYETPPPDYRMLSNVATPTNTKVYEGNLCAKTKIEMKFVIKPPQLSRGQTMTVSKSWYDTIQANMGPDVALVGSDGNVVVKKMLLTSHSAAFEAMFNFPTSKESQTGRVEIKDYPQASLKSMVHFFATHEIIDGNGTTCDLLLLADKYGIKELKSRAEMFLLKNVDSVSAREVYRIFTKVSPQLLEELFVKTQALK